MLGWLWNHLEEVGSCVLLGVMVTIAFINVVTRYVISFSMAFTEELTVYLFVWATLLGTALTFKKGTNMVVTILYDRFPKRGRKFLYLISCLLSIVFFSLLGYYGYIQVRDERMLQVTTESMHMPLWIFSASIPVGCILILFRIIAKAYNDLRNMEY